MKFLKNMFPQLLRITGKNIFSRVFRIYSALSLLIPRCSFRNIFIISNAEVQLVSRLEYIFQQIFFSTKYFSKTTIFNNCKILFLYWKILQIFFFILTFTNYNVCLQHRLESFRTIQKLQKYCVEVFRYLQHE